MLFKKPKDENDDDRNFDKIAEALAVATQNNSNITQFLINESSNTYLSRAVSIHSLHDSVTHDSRNEIGDSDSIRPTNVITNDSSDSDSNFRESVPIIKIIDTKDKEGGVLQSLQFSIKFIFLLLLNVITITITAECMFICLVYVFTGKYYIEFRVPKSPQTWMEKARELTFGLDEDTVQIRSIFQLFHRQNLLDILRYLARKEIF